MGMQIRPLWVVRTQKQEPPVGQNGGYFAALSWMSITLCDAEDPAGRLADPAGLGMGRRMMVAVKAPRRATPRHLPGSPFNAPARARPIQTFAVHDQVTHDSYGLGVILGVENDAVIVDFRPHQRRISLPCAKLTKL
jgi:hypothetical protein